MRASLDLAKRNHGRRVRLAVLAGACLAAVACGKDAPVVERPPLPVETIAVPVRDLELVYTEMATLVSPDAAVLGSEVAGRITALPRDEGEDVRAGEELVRLDAAVASSQASEGVDRVRQAEVALAAAERDRERTRVLAEGGVATRQELDAAADRVELARTSLDALRSGLGTTRAVLAKHVVRAPRAGVVIRRPVELGEMVAPGQVLIEVAPVRTLRAECHVPERLAPLLREGDTVLVESAGETTAGTIVRIAPAVEPGTRTVKIEVEVANEARRLRPGSFARLRFVLERRSSVVCVPLPSVRTEVSGEKYVLAVEGTGDGATVRRASIRTGLEAGGWVEVLEGLRPAETIVTLGASLITPGTRVAPRPDRRPAYAPYAEGGSAPSTGENRPARDLPGRDEDPEATGGVPAGDEADTVRGRPAAGAAFGPAA